MLPSREQVIDRAIGTKDERQGVLALKTRRCGTHPDGYAGAWLAGTEPGEFYASIGWTIGHSQRMKFTATEDATGTQNAPLAHNAEGGVRKPIAGRARNSGICVATSHREIRLAVRGFPPSTIG